MHISITIFVPLLVITLFTAQNECVVVHFQRTWALLSKYRKSSSAEQLSDQPTREVGPTVSWDQQFNQCDHCISSCTTLVLPVMLKHFTVQHSQPQLRRCSHYYRSFSKLLLAVTSCDCSANQVPSVFPFGSSSPLQEVQCQFYIEYTHSRF